MSDVPPPHPPPPPPPGYGAPAAGGGPPPPLALAEIGPRVIALLIDIGIVVAGYIVLWILAAAASAISDGLVFLVLALGWLALAGFPLYNAVYLEGTTGQTIGKKQQGVKVVGLENGGQPLGPVMAFVRLLINWLPCNLGWFLAFFDPQRQTLGDKVTKSIVVPA